MKEIIETIQKHIPELITEGSITDIIDDLLSTHSESIDDDGGKKIFFAVVDETMYRIEVGHSFCDVFKKGLDEVAKVYEGSGEPSIEWDDDDENSMEF